ncbi:MAG TPA: protein kinase [Polyangiaceae bacterium]|nr:protein kinase [Polyangiaceae bacterium]
MNTLSPNSLVAGRYLLKRPIGGGGMGAVWLAEHVELRAPCAVKLIDREAVLNPEFRRRFTREARAAALLRSTHVVQVLDSGEWRGQPYLVMELLEGEDLRDCLLRTSRLPPADCLEIARQIARALSKAHAAGIVHRDLKPANVFLTRDDDRLVVKVLDFGIAKYDADLEDTTDSCAVLGTPHYMSPEQCRGAGQVDFRSDLWSLAVIVFECLTGSRPFPGPNLVQLVHQISVGDLPLPSAVRPGLPASLDAWWQRAIQRDPAQRFGTAREMVDALAAALDLPTWPASSGDPTPLGVGRGPLSSAPSSPGAGRGPLSSAPSSFSGGSSGLDPTVPQAHLNQTSRWVRTLKGTGAPLAPLLPPPPEPGVVAIRPSQAPALRSSAADLPTQASAIRFANNEPTTRPSAKLAAFVPPERLSGVPSSGSNHTPAAHTTSFGSLSRTQLRRPVERAPESMRSLGFIAIGAAALFTLGGTISRLAPNRATAGGAPLAVSGTTLSAVEPEPAPRPLEPAATASAPAPRRAPHDEASAPSPHFAADPPGPSARRAPALRPTPSTQGHGPPRR